VARRGDRRIDAERREEAPSPEAGADDDRGRVDLAGRGADAGDPDQVRGSVDEGVALLGGLDVLVNNAGVGVQAGVLETPLDSYDLVMDVNVRGAFVYAQAAFPHLEARGVLLRGTRKSAMRPVKRRPGALKRFLADRDA